MCKAWELIYTSAMLNGSIHIFIPFFIACVGNLPDTAQLITLMISQSTIPISLPLLYPSIYRSPPPPTFPWPLSHALYLTLSLISKGLLKICPLYCLFLSTYTFTIQLVWILCYRCKYRSDVCDFDLLDILLPVSQTAGLNLSRVN